METPVYIFTGFLEGGKTTFIQDTLEDKRFNSGEKTLLLICEEGEIEYDPSRFSGKNVTIKVIENEDDLSEQTLSSWQNECGAVRVLVEYNGMWQIQSFYDSMPEGWIPYQNMLFFATPTFLSYNANMRSLVVDKLKDCDVCIFNRVPDGFDTIQLHKIVRAVTRRSDIIYEANDGQITPDEIEDPLPFDVNASFIEIEDRDFALFYRDLTEEMKKYKGKTVKFTGLVATDGKFPARTCAIGRHIMTCCAADIAFCGLVSKLPDGIKAKNGEWYTVTAVIDVRFSRLYGKIGPVFNVSQLVPTEAPVEQVATFY